MHFSSEHTTEIVCVTDNKSNEQKNRLRESNKIIEKSTQL